jgi:hypothetical protein
MKKNELVCVFLCSFGVLQAASDVRCQASLERAGESCCQLLDERASLADQ